MLKVKINITDRLHTQLKSKCTLTGSSKSSLCTETGNKMQTIVSTPKGVPGSANGFMSRASRGRNQADWCLLNDT